MAPRLRPELLHRVIDAVGLEDCAELVAQATPAQLSHLFDLDLWRPTQPGLDEQFDVDRFGVWLEVLIDAGDQVAAEKLAGMPLPQLVAGFAHYVRVFDLGSVISFETTSGERWDYSAPVQGRTGIEIGGYHVVAKREDVWDAITTVLVALETYQPDRFHELMAAVRLLSNSRREEDGFHSLLHDREQMMFDVTFERERRRQERGFASPADARAFLQMSRAVTPGSIQPNPLARDYQRSIDITTADEQASASAEEYEAVELLADAGVITMAAPQALLGSGDAPALSRLERDLRVVFERDAAAYGDRNFELAYLANVLLAGCSIQGRPFTTKEATDATIAICNLGLERMAPADDYLVSDELIGVFQVGWTMLHREVCVAAARQLIDVLGRVRVIDDDLQRSLNLLRVRLMRELDAGTPWKASAALDVMTQIDLPAWAALVGLIAECPVIHAGLIASIDPGVRSVDPTAFEFLATPEQLSLVGKFLQAVPSILSPGA